MKLIKSALSIFRFYSGVRVKNVTFPPEVKLGLKSEEMDHLLTDVIKEQQIDDFKEDPSTILHLKGLPVVELGKKLSDQQIIKQQKPLSEFLYKFADKIGLKKYPSSRLFNIPDPQVIDDRDPAVIPHTDFFGDNPFGRVDALSLTALSLDDKKTPTLLLPSKFIVEQLSDEDREILSKNIFQRTKYGKSFSIISIDKKTGGVSMNYDPDGDRENTIILNSDYYEKAQTAMNNLDSIIYKCATQKDLITKAQYEKVGDGFIFDNHSFLHFRPELVEENFLKKVVNLCIPPSPRTLIRHYFVKNVNDAEKVKNGNER